jgi:CBS domain-containing protein
MARPPTHGHFGRNAGGSTLVSIVFQLLGVLLLPVSVVVPKSGERWGWPVHVKEVLASKGSVVFTVAPDTPVVIAVEQLALHNVGAIVVSHDGRSIEGIVSERDVVRAIHAVGPNALSQPVESIMTTEVRTASLEDSVDALMETMTTHRIRHIPVLEDGAMVGIVSIGDVVKSRTEELERDRAALVDYIGAR